MMDDIEETSDPRLWKKAGWVARVIKNENDEGWAVAMTRDGDQEPALVSPWTMGRDKVNPKPLNNSDFSTLLKGARDVLKRHEHALRAKLHKSECPGPVSPLIAQRVSVTTTTLFLGLHRAHATSVSSLAKINKVKSLRASAPSITAFTCSSKKP